MEILGHSTTAMIKRYQHVSPGLTIAAAERMRVGPQHAQPRFSYLCAGSMLTLSRNTLSGSYLRFTSASRA